MNFQATAEQAKKAITTSFGKNVEVTVIEKGVTVTATADILLDLMKFLRQDKSCRFDFFSFLTGIDYPDKIVLVYRVASSKHGAAAFVKIPLAKEVATAPSVMKIWAGADWHERETAEMFGVFFEGHPDPRKLLLTEDNDAHPLRKDFRLDYGD